MFLRTKSRTDKNGVFYEYLYLVENRRVNGKVVQRTLSNLGRTNEPGFKEKMNKLVASLIGKYCDYNSFSFDKLECNNTKTYGPLLIFKRLWTELNLGEVLNKSFLKYDTFFDLADCIFSMVLSRLIDPCSKRGLLEFQKEVYDLSPFELHQFYRSMDYLVDNQEEIEKNIFDQMLKTTGTNLDMVFFDTTTIVYFGDGGQEDEEGEVESELLAKGFSKDHRGDLKQVVVGVVMSKDGIPLAHEVFAGNKNDVTCFKQVIESLVAKFDIKKVVLVGDRGMISMTNLRFLEDLGLEYILGFRMRTIKKESRAEIFKKVDMKKLRGINRPKGAEGLQAKEAEYQGKRIVVYYDEERAQKDKEHREEILQELNEKTKNGTIYGVVTNQNYKRYLNIEGKDPKVCKKKVQTDELYDGVFVLTTNTKLSANQIVKSYRDLWHVEQGFRWLKGELEMGPIYHFKDRRIKAHVMICFLSLILKVMLNKKLKSLKNPASYPEVVSSLKRYSVVEMSLENSLVHMTTKVEPNAKKAFKAINMRVPEKIVYSENTEFVLAAQM